MTMKLKRVLGILLTLALLLGMSMTAYADSSPAVSATVTLKVVNGSWGDGTREDKTIVLTGNAGDELRLALSDLPGVTKPDEGYEYASGKWTPEEPPIKMDGFVGGDPITEDTTYTFTYGEKKQALTVTLKVVNGSWSDGTKDDRTIFLNGEIGEELRLKLSDLPGVTKPDEGYEYASGVWTPEEPPIEMDGFVDGNPITEDTTYTFTYGIKRQALTVTLKVVNGSWDDGTKDDRTIFLNGEIGEELRLALSDIPDVTKPDEGYEYASGKWTPEEPPVEMDGYVSGAPITKDMTYTFTYGKKQDKPIPKTGDSDHPALWLGLMLLGLIGIAVLGKLAWSAKRKK